MASGEGPVRWPSGGSPLLGKQSRVQNQRRGLPGDDLGEALVRRVQEVVLLFGEHGGGHGEGEAPSAGGPARQGTEIERFDLFAVWQLHFEEELDSVLRGVPPPVPWLVVKLASAECPSAELLPACSIGPLIDNSAALYRWISGGQERSCAAWASREVRRVPTSRAEIATSRAEIATSRAEIATSQAEIATSRAEIATSQAGIATSRAEITTSRAEIATSQAGRAANSADVVAKPADVVAKPADVVAKPADVATKPVDLAANSTKHPARRKEAAGGFAELAGTFAELARGLAELARGLAESARGLAESAGGLAELAGGLVELVGGLVELVGGPPATR